MNPFIWITLKQAQALHHSMIKHYGGGEGVRDEGLLESALSNPQNLFFYEGATIFECAAAYAKSISQNHVFVDGKKRTGFMVAVVFLSINGFRLKPQENKNHENAMVDLAEKRLNLSDFAKYLEQHSIQI